MMFRRAQTAARQRPSHDALALSHVTYSFGDYTAVKDLSLVIEAGECFGLLGPNGAGKTTTIRLLNTLLPLQEGDVSIFGYDVRTQAMAVRRLLGYVPQQLSIEGALTARENVSWFARLYDVPRSERRRRVDEVLEMVDLADAADRVASSFSGGMVRRLELAQALVNRPSLLVLDEPTVGLDPVARDSVWTRVTEMQKQYGMTVLLTTHYMEEAEALCDRVALMHRGELRAVGSPSGLVAELGPDATLDDVFRHFTGDSLTADEKGGLRDVRSARRTARRLG
ncbi:nodulation ABC transporter NodI [Rhodococcus opacus PD630]|uniref:ABC transporter ATP-binding protein n=1 Tax=Rhodococcus opacus TaxID=37919 RepID=UPI00029CB2AC|nr:ATP-binding cassette domain-containing protein [Rhodococcus opacus]NDV03081.1 ATP-binding cassette domain-containing protein [Rhodococcus sp. IEGM 248]AHK28533.1 putative ABC transporter ATP-binding protein YfiL [Rhodococcus opacus PD630]EHI44408.1 nodulation ABC transporter NodI [Rhodococcus opacus PD630]MDV7082930.1 ATP-binding cassette domain-containing protein [Rhodococcus opacus]UDG98407.1 ATP-binding cassette domain-containing protein [Rhodococcus opacus PD630]